MQSTNLPTLWRHKRLSCLILLLLGVFCAGGTGAQVISQSPISPADGWEFGNALASAGNTLVVGDQGWVRGSGASLAAVGAAYVYTLSNGQWTQQARLTASDGQTGDLFGCSVAISGSTIVVGALQHNGVGAAYVFTLSKGVWTQQQELTASDGVGGDEFGCSAAISGSTLAIGACHRGVGSAGAVYTYTVAKSGWVRQATITNSPISTSYALFGYSLALSSNTLLVGAPGDLYGSGAAYITTLKSGAWSPLAALPAPDMQDLGQFGFSVALSGNTAAIGAPGISTAYVFTLSGGTWNQQAALAPFEGPTIAGFGSALTISGGTLVVSALNADDTGVYVFSNASSGWTPAYELTPGGLSQTFLETQFGTAVAIVGNTVLVGRPFAVSVPTWYFMPVGTVNGFVLGGVESQDAFADLLGGAVALSGNTLLAGAPSANGDAGAVFTYTRKSATVTALTTLAAADGQLGDGFGTSLAFDGKTLVVGAPYANYGAGTVYLFSYSAGVWKPAGELTATDGQQGDFFGLSVSLSGATLAIGAPGRINDTGAVYLYSKKGAAWKLQSKLAASDGQSEDAFGLSVALDGNNLLVGAPNADTLVSSGAGAAYLYSLAGGKWQPLTKLFPPDGQFGAQFGAAVGLSGNNAAVGAPGDGSLASVVYTYVQTTAGWLPNSELNDGWMQSDGFGAALALSGNTLLVGAYDGNALTGAAYLFSLKSGAWSLTYVYTALDGQQGDDFGVAVSLSGTSVLIGAPYANYGAGSFYGF
jgi:hypothetical protein